MQLLKAMYGTLTAALFWYDLFAGNLKEDGFSINQYDQCVANKLVNGHQLTICWYVDDLKISHKDPDVVTQTIKMLEKKFGSMSTTRGKKHTYLGMDFEVKNGEVTIMMKQYMEECIKSFGEAISSPATTPSTKSLMEVNDKAIKLDERRQRIFHHIVQKMLHVCKRTRLDLQVTVGFLCTRVRCPTEQDWAKLRRMLQYVFGTLDMPRVISIENFDKMDIFIDAAHGTHWDMRGQTGGCMRFDKGVIHCRTNKQNLNSKSSTETELIGNSDYLPYSIWIIYFFENQGYQIGEKLLHQDNQSTMRMLKNGKKSCGKQSRHINLRMFWTTDKLRELEISVVHCRTELMLGDFFTKPLQGNLFRRMRDVILGLGTYDELMVQHERNRRKEPTESKGEMKNNKCNQECNKPTKILMTNRKERVGIMKKRVSFGDSVKSAAKTIKGRSRSYVEVVRRNLRRNNHSKE